MSRQKSRGVIETEDFVVALLWVALMRLPRRWVEALCLVALKGVLALMPRRHRMMRQQLASSFPEKKRAELETILNGSLENIARSLWFFARLPEVAQGTKGPAITVVGQEHLQAALDRGQGVIVFTAHYGCWEAMIVAIAQRFPKVAVAARPLDNPKLDARINRIRQCTGAQIIPRRRLLKEGLRSLRDNGILGILIDQNYAHGGLFVDFFGRPAATTSIVSTLAKRTGAIVLPMSTRWTDDHVEIICEPEFPLSTAVPPTLAIAQDTQKMTQTVERWIHQDPSQWLWLHNRWKRRPQPEDMIYTPGKL